MEQAAHAQPLSRKGTSRRRAPPRPAAEVRAEAIRTLMRHGKVNQHEASYYLDEPGGGTDVAAALAALEADRAGSGEGEWVVVNSRDGVLAREMVKVELS